MQQGGIFVTEYKRKKAVRIVGVILAVVVLLGIIASSLAAFL